MSAMDWIFPLDSVCPPEEDIEEDVELLLGEGGGGSPLPALFSFVGGYAKLEGFPLIKSRAKAGETDLSERSEFILDFTLLFENERLRKPPRAFSYEKACGGEYQHEAIYS
jgi:hypothetical protein